VADVGKAMPDVSVPVAFSVFPKEMYGAPRSWLEFRHGDHELSELRVAKMALTGRSQAEISHTTLGNVSHGP